MRELSIVELNIVSGGAAQNFLDALAGAFVGGVLGRVAGSLKATNDTSKVAGPFGFGNFTVGLGFLFGGFGGLISGATQGFTQGYSGISQKDGYIDTTLGDLTQGSLLT